MKSEKPEFRVGYVEFATPTCLLLGSTDSFSWLADQIRNRNAVVLDCVGAVPFARLSIRPSDGTGCLVVARDTLEWQISAGEAKLASEQLIGLAANPAPSHAYLDPNSNLTGIQILASKDEYDAADVFEL
jgi:hypothetical protein